MPSLSLDDFSDNDEIEEDEKEIRKERLIEIKGENFDILGKVIKPMLKGKNAEETVMRPRQVNEFPFPLH